MNNLFAALAVMLSLGVVPAKANNHEYKNTAQYLQMEKDTRESLKNCLNNESINTKDCIKNYKKLRKDKKKEIKKAYNKENM